MSSYHLIYNWFGLLYSFLCTKRIINLFHCIFTLLFILWLCYLSLCYLLITIIFFISSCKYFYTCLHLFFNWNIIFIFIIDLIGSISLWYFRCSIGRCYTINIKINTICWFYIIGIIDLLICWSCVNNISIICLLVIYLFFI